MPIKKSKTELRRYMPATAMLDMLLHNHLVLLNPKSWDDRNDSHFVEVYRKRANLESIRAACFSAKAETYHHWKVFAPGDSGVCVIFDRARLTSWVDNMNGLRGGHVTYLTTQALKKRTEVATADVPFLKRQPYSDECEYRIIFEDSLWNGDDVQKFKLPESVISRIVCSPWMPKDVYLSLKQIARSIGDWSQLTVTRSTLVETEMWKDALAALGETSI